MSLQQHQYTLDAHCDVFTRKVNISVVHWQLWDGSKLLGTGHADTFSDALYNAWSWYVDWCYQYCPSRLEFLGEPYDYYPSIRS